MSSGSLPERAQADLLVARRARDTAATAALRELLAAISNAEAPPAPTTSPAAPPGLGPAEHDRLELTAADHARILDDQVQARVDAIAEYDALGQTAAAQALRDEVAVLRRYRIDL